MGRLIIDGNQVYEMDEECLRKKAQEEARQKRKEQQSSYGRVREGENAYRN